MAKKINEVELPAYDILDAQAIQALMKGEAIEEQQIRAMKWIIEKASNMYGFSYFPTDRDTNFALGRTFVGQVIVGLSKVNTMNLKPKEKK